MADMAGLTKPTGFPAKSLRPRAGGTGAENSSCWPDIEIRIRLQVSNRRRSLLCSKGLDWLGSLTAVYFLCQAFIRMNKFHGRKLRRLSL
jgi:hypothetical protein